MIEITYPNNEALSDDYIREMSSSLPRIESISQDMQLATFNHASPVTSEPELMGKFFDKVLGLGTRSRGRTQTRRERASWVLEMRSSPISFVISPTRRLRTNSWQGKYPPHSNGREFR